MYAQSQTSGGHNQSPHEKSGPNLSVLQGPHVGQCIQSACENGGEVKDLEVNR